MLQFGKARCEKLWDVSGHTGWGLFTGVTFNGGSRQIYKQGERNSNGWKGVGWIRWWKYGWMYWSLTLRSPQSVKSTWPTFSDTVTCLCPVSSLFNVIFLVQKKKIHNLKKIYIFFFFYPHPCHQVAETRCKKVCTSKSDLRTNDFSIVGSLPRDFELSNFDCYGKPIETAAGKSQSKNNKRPPPPKPVIPSAAKRVDLYARALFPFSFLFFNVIYWSIYLWLCGDEGVEPPPPPPPFPPSFTPVSSFLIRLQEKANF